MEHTEERVDRLEVLFGQFMIQINTAILRIDRAIEEMKEEGERSRKEDRKEWNKRWGELANKMGTLVEDIVAPNIPYIAQKYFGFEDIEDFAVRRIIKNKKDKSRTREFDVIALSGNKVIINETKSTPKIDYINNFKDALNEIEDYFPEYRDKKIIPIFASLYIREDIVAYLTRINIYAMAMGSEDMDILNFGQLKEKIHE